MHGSITDKNREQIEYSKLYRYSDKDFNGATIGFGLPVSENAITELQWDVIMEGDINV